MWESGHQREKEKTDRKRETEKHCQGEGGEQFYFFPLCSPPEDLHLSLFLPLSLHQVKIPWWCFHLPVLSNTLSLRRCWKAHTVHFPLSWVWMWRCVLSSCHYLFSRLPSSTFLAVFIFFAIIVMIFLPDWRPICSITPTAWASISFFRSLLWIWSRKQIFVSHTNLFWHCDSAVRHDRQKKSFQTPQTWPCYCLLQPDITTKQKVCFQHCGNSLSFCYFRLSQFFSSGFTTLSSTLVY